MTTHKLGSFLTPSSITHIGGFMHTSEQSVPEVCTPILLVAWRHLWMFPNLKTLVDVVSLADEFEKDEGISSTNNSGSGWAHLQVLVEHGSGSARQLNPDELGLLPILRKVESQSVRSCNCISSCKTGTDDFVQGPIFLLTFECAVANLVANAADISAKKLTR